MLLLPLARAGLGTLWKTRSVAVNASDAFTETPRKPGSSLAGGSYPLPIDHGGSGGSDIPGTTRSRRCCEAAIYGPALAPTSHLIRNAQDDPYVPRPLTYIFACLPPCFPHDLIALSLSAITNPDISGLHSLILIATCKVHLQCPNLGSRVIHF